MIEVKCAVCGDTGEAPICTGLAACREFVICGMCDAWDVAHPAPPAPTKRIHGFTLLVGGQYHLPTKKKK